MTRNPQVYGGGNSVHAESPRDVAEIVAGELRKQGRPVPPEVVDFIEAKVEEEVAKFLAAERLSGVVKSQLETPLRVLGDQFERMARQASRSMVHG